MRGFAPLVLALAMAQLAVTAAAQSGSGTLYRWVDKDGHVHFGDQPGAADAKRLNSNTPDSGDDDAATAAAKAAADKQAAACQQKQQQLDTYAKSTSITETDALGNQHEYTQDQKTQLMDKTRQYLDQNCATKQQ